MRVLVGCEYSGIVRDAFIAKGHDAISCDLLPTEAPGPHFQEDVLEVIKRERFDLGIFHPTCTYLTISANKWYKDQPERKSGTLVGAARRQARQEAIEFFMALWNAPIPKICIENPIGIMSTVFRKPDQVIQPWMFGNPETKATCLWLKRLPPLYHYARTDLFNHKTHIELPAKESERMRIHHLPPSPDRWKIRSLTFPGIARAFADQWG
jgi:hypothetical protein